MRRSLVLGVMFATAALPLAGANHGPVVLLSVDNGDNFYCTPIAGVRNCVNPAQCVNDSNIAAGRIAVRHWHVGLPFVALPAEALGGFGCMGAPKTFPVTVAAGHQATGTGTVKYTWDTNVAGGCCNDVHLHVFDAAGVLVYSTLTDVTEGPKPVVPNVLQVRSHAVNFVLGPGTYRIQEDIFSGEHTAWLTKLSVVEN